jgi:hypothetical protein
LREHSRLRGFIELRDRRFKSAGGERMEDKIHADAGIILEGGIANPFMKMTYSSVSSYLLEEWNSIKHDSFSGGAGR